MSDQNVPAPYILLKQQTGERKPNQEGEKPLSIYFFRGEILLEIPEKEQIPRKDGTPAHNYCKYDDPDVTTYDIGINASPLHGAELDYLLGIKRPSVRAVEYLQVDKLAWIMDLRLGSNVFFKLNKEKEVSLIIRGRIRYYGAIAGHEGVMFGIEIIDKEHRGKGTTDGYPHFQCGDNNAVYVSMDKIIMSKSEERKDQLGLRKENSPALNTRSRTSDKPPDEGSTKKKEGKGILEKVKDKTKAFITGPPIVAPDFTSRVDSQFSEGDRVVVQTVRQKVITGTVRWVGPVKTSKEDGGIIVPVVGIETDKKIDVDKEFPNLHYDLFQHQFPIPPNHSRVYLPEQLVLHIDEYAKQKQENNIFEVKEAQKWNLSVEEYRAQVEMLSKSNEERDKDHKTRVDLPYNEENLAVGEEPGDSFPPIRPGESVEQRLGVDEMQKQQMEYERIQKEHQRRHSEDFQLQDSAHIRPNEGQDQPVSLPSNPVYQNIPHYPGSFRLGEDEIRLQREEYEMIQREQKRKHSLEDYESLTTEQQQPLSNSLSTNSMTVTQLTKEITEL